jgi:branched-subunit amino acid aminotransferase/4-amino-4-deoxychorismate lyase
VSVALLNGQPAGADDLRALALVNYGHFSSMQVRDHSVQGLELHRQRLTAATWELFDSALDFESVRAQMRQAVADAPDCTLRVTVFSRDFDYRNPAAGAAPDVLVTPTPPTPPRTLPLRVKSFPFQRPLPQIKHVGIFPLFHYRRLAMRSGFDDALFVDPAGAISEGSVWNIGFWTGTGVVWPQAAALRGTAEKLLQAGLDRQGVEQVTRPVFAAELPDFKGVFACNASGIQSIASIDEISFATGHDGMVRLSAASALARWETL